MILEIVKKYFEPSSILDIGGHTGEFFNLCNNNFIIKNYFLIEGNKHCEKDIKQLNVPYYIGLVGSYDGEVNYYMTKDDIKSTGNSIYIENSIHFSQDRVIIEKKPILTLNTLFKNYDKQFDLIKIDTQGSELDILRGGTDLHKSAKGIILEVSLTEYNKNAPLENNVIEYMNTINFKQSDCLWEHKFADGSVFQKDILFLNKNIFTN
jgi:FkbM family methyltransferase